MKLDWIKCTGDVWCQLSTVNLEHSHFDGMEGVYIIWHGGSKPHSVRIGQGIIRDRLTAHKSDVAVQAYENYGLYVTWAAVASTSRDGIEAYLAEKLDPRVGERSPAVPPIEVNMPW